MQRILIVEDEEVIRNSLVKLLERNGYAPEAAANIQDATQRYALADFDLIIRDLPLPGPPGPDLIKVAGEVAVLLMPSYARLGSAVDTMKVGAVDYIPKPFDQKEVLSSIKRIFSMQSTAKQFRPPAH